MAQCTKYMIHKVYSLFTIHYSLFTSIWYLIFDVHVMFKCTLYILHTTCYILYAWLFMHKLSLFIHVGCIYSVHCTVCPMYYVLGHVHTKYEIHVHLVFSIQLFQDKRGRIVNRLSA